ncbi:hypothetical protein DERP_012256 [Dermatophagoides pteronyssinus]|uniref:Uncharacterized protein n=1 Tax=Dermatophagoides pteronyssinus TaxID=6956 RepID=A0ABQ8JG08_DERPT|nr:hypothetical protein DERP_012256 [Dermatophagoides pteronyssinus]
MYAEAKDKTDPSSLSFDDCAIPILVLPYVESPLPLPYELNESSPFGPPPFSLDAIKILLDDLDPPDEPELLLPAIIAIPGGNLDLSISIATILITIIQTGRSSKSGASFTKLIQQIH